MRKVRYMWLMFTERVLRAYARVSPARRQRLLENKAYVRQQNEAADKRVTDNNTRIGEDAWEQAAEAHARFVGENEDTSR